ncbi:hypothetical protein MB02_13430 [Croceicoccus estronivorus]|nr:hypothetical protein MB02_13430 [Croceicoccus estronivorus]
MAGPALGQDLPQDEVSSQARAGGKGRVEITPYIEASQVITSELSPGNDTVTYTRLAAGVDASINGRNTSGGVSLRYERQFGWGKDASDGDLLSGLARVSAAVIPQALTVEAGGLAARTRVESNGGSILGPVSDGDDVSNLYSVYAGPSLNTHVGEVAVNADYRIGYSRVDSPDAEVVTTTGDLVDVFDESVIQSANIHAGTRPGDVLPVGLGVGAGWNREDVSNLDQRIDDRHVRADVTVPVSQSVALVGGVGYEHVEVSHRDVLRDGSGEPVIGSDGHYKTDKSQPRRIAYDVDGMIWDVGIIWRPSPRTSLEAHFGRRYGSSSFYGNFGWQASRRSSLNISVYDSVAGYGGQLNRALVSLPTDFQAIRNPISGDISGCVDSLKDGSCISGALGSLRSATFRARGISATYALDLGRIQTGIGVGYDRRKYIAAEGTILESIDGATDENVWLAAYLNGRLGPRSSFSTNVYASWMDSGLDQAGGATAFGASAAYNHLLARRLTATAAIGIDGVSREEEEDYWTASALVGMRYSF